MTTERRRAALLQRLMQPLTNWRRCRNDNFCARASFSQLARFSIATLSAAAISPGLFGFTGAVCENAGIATNAVSMTNVKMRGSRDITRDPFGIRYNAVTRLLCRQFVKGCIR